MRLSAYVLAGDPAWIGSSIASYYPLVDRIIVSYDRSRRSWSGHPLSVDAALTRLKDADPEHKLRLLPGDHSDSSRFALHVETEQRQAALDAASDGADWVLQLDTDEILAAPQVFTQHLENAAGGGFGALAFPLRWFYSRTASGRFLEVCGRWWTTQSSYPGPLAVRSGTRLTHARQASTTRTFRVDVSSKNTDPAHPRNVPVHAVIAPHEAALHMSWVRTQEQMSEKSVVSGYATSRDWQRELAAWKWRTKHPWLASAPTPLRRHRFGRYRVVQQPEYATVDP